MSIFLHLYPYLFLMVCGFYTSHVWCLPKTHGRYTRDVDNYQLVLPHKLTPTGKFLSFSLPNYFKHVLRDGKKKKSIADTINYGIFVDGNHYHLKLWPNTNLLSPQAFVEHRDLSVDIDKRKLNLLKGAKICHYTGKVEGVPNSSVSLSTCDGLAGYIRIDGKSYFIEPLHEHGPDERGHHIHLIHKRESMLGSKDNGFCGISEEFWKQHRTLEKRNNRGGPPFHQPPFHQPPFHQPPFQQPPHHQPPLHQPPFQQPPFQQPPFQQLPFQQPPFQQPPFHQPPFHQPPFQQPPHHQPPLHQPPFQQPPFQQPPFQQPPIQQPPFQQPSPHQPPFQQPPFQQPPLQQPPFHQPPPTNQQHWSRTHKYIEVLVVCDKYFMDRHRHIDVQNYVLTIFNMVSDLYHDSTLGIAIDITIVRIIYIEREEDQITLSSNADLALDAFCQWQQTLNPRDAQSPVHYDIAILLTRYDICNDISCNLLGIAYTGTVCDPTQNCGVAEESGLSVGYIVTHQIGHLVGCPDDDFHLSGCNPRAPDGSFYVMNRIDSDNVTVWSKCSYDYMTTLFANGFGGCLDNIPPDSLYHFPEMLPGVVFDSSAQCDWLQQGSQVCPYSNHEICTGLMCSPLHTDYCVSMGGKIAMPGTPCGNNKWCYKTHCVERGERPDSVDGGWSEWGDWGECSRSCGGGVSFRERTCDNPFPERGGRYCVGDKKQVVLCNAQPCPPGSKDFRAVQCAEFDDKPINYRASKWKPLIQKDEPCVLYCTDENNQFSKLGARVKDGTKCTMGRRDTCIGGVCRKVGCDFALDSDVEEDNCGVCGGNGQTCSVVGGTYKGAHKSIDFMVQFPRGAYKIVVTELQPSANTIALGINEKKLCLNDHNNEYPDGVYDCFNTSMVYSHPKPNQELLTIRGPLTQPLSLYTIFYVHENVSFDYQYADLTIARKEYNPKYTWEHIEFSHCSHICDGGIQMSEASCVEEKMGKLSPEFCKDIEKPQPVTRTCNDRPCKISWRVASWGPCRACGSKAGIKMREVECVQESRFLGGDEVILEEDKCKDPKPPSSRYCSRKGKGPSKRCESDFPEYMMKELFYQTIVDMLTLDPRLKEYFVSQARTIRGLRRHLRYHKRDPDVEEICAIMMASTTESPKNPPMKVKSGPKSGTEIKTGALVSNDKASMATTNTEGSKHKILKAPNNGTDIEIGATVLDHHPRELNIMEVRSGGMIPVSNMSEEAFQLLGNNFENTLIFDSKRNYSGKMAEQCLLSLQKLEGNSSNA